MPMAGCHKSRGKYIVTGWLTDFQRTQSPWSNRHAVTSSFYSLGNEMSRLVALYVSAVNPLLIKEYGNNSLRKVKTDKADAIKIAKYALDNWAELRDYERICNGLNHLYPLPILSVW